jgi:predicted Zn-dependent protease with MMP-like domain
MKAPTDSEFEALLNQALDELPQEYVQRMLQDVAVTYEDEPSADQRRQQKLDPHHTLLGLYEGTPRPVRDFGGFGAPQLPDKITIFKNPIAAACRTEAELKDQVKKTVWHEMAHYFGLDHGRIHELE